MILLFVFIQACSKVSISNITFNNLFMLQIPSRHHSTHRYALETGRWKHTDESSTVSALEEPIVYNRSENVNTWKQNMTHAFRQGLQKLKEKIRTSKPGFFWNTRKGNEPSILFLNFKSTSLQRSKCTACICNSSNSAQSHRINPIREWLMSADHSWEQLWVLFGLQVLREVMEC